MMPDTHSIGATSIASAAPIYARPDLIHAQQHPADQLMLRALRDEFSQEIRARGLDDVAGAIAKVSGAVNPSSVADTLAASSSSAPVSKLAAARRANKEPRLKVTPTQGANAWVQFYDAQWYQQNKELRWAYTQRPDVKARTLARQRLKRQQMSSQQTVRPPRKPRTRRSALQSPMEKERRRRERSTLASRRRSEKQWELRQARERGQAQARLDALTDAQKLSLVAENQKAQSGPWGSSTPARRLCGSSGRQRRER